MPGPLVTPPEEGFEDTLDPDDATGSDPALLLKSRPDVDCVYLLQRRQTSTIDSNLSADIRPIFVPVAVDLPWLDSLEPRGPHPLRLHSSLAGSMRPADSPRSCNFKPGGVYLVTTTLKALHRGLEGGMDVKRRSNVSRTPSDYSKPAIPYELPSTFDPKRHGWEKVRRNARKDKLSNSGTSVWMKKGVVPTSKGLRSTTEVVNYLVNTGAMAPPPPTAAVTESGPSTLLPGETVEPVSQDTAPAAAEYVDPSFFESVFYGWLKDRCTRQYHRTHNGVTDIRRTGYCKNSHRPTSPYA